MSGILKPIAGMLLALGIAYVGYLGGHVIVGIIGAVLVAGVGFHEGREE